jgi:hypothetical protein
VILLAGAAATLTAVRRGTTITLAVLLMLIFGAAILQFVILA